MGTRCRIGIRNADDSVDSIYVHYDGHPERTGRVLVEHYQDEAKIRELIALGDLVNLAPEIGDKHPYSKLDFPGGYDAYKKMYGHMCLAFGRDRGDENVQAVHSDIVDDFLQINGGEEYCYIWHYGRWMVRSPWDGDADSWRLVHEALGIDLNPPSIPNTNVKTTTPVIKPINQAGSFRTGALRGIKVSEITKILGFKSNIADDPDKVRYSWGFLADDEQCGIWDYKGSYRSGEFSTYGSADIFVKLFGDRYTRD